MLIRRLVFLVAFVMLALGFTAARPAQAGLVVSIVASGTITEGDGGSGNSLAGLSVTLVQEFSAGGPLFSSPSFSVAAFDRVVLGVLLGNNPAIFVDSDLVGSGGAFYNISMVANGFGAVASAASILVTFGFVGEIQTFMDVSNPTAEVAPNSSLGQNFTFPPFPNGTNLSFGLTQYIEGDIASYFFVERATEISVVVTQVPAPAALGLFVVGLAGLGLARRRGTPITP